MQMKELLAAIAAGENVRAGLSDLKKEIKKPGGRKECLALLGGDLSAITLQLGAEDAKTRKNAAGVLGELKRQESLLTLYEAYLHEETLFVKSAYLEAMKGLDYTSLLPELRDIREELSGQEFPVEEQKHRLAELAALTDLIGEAEAAKKHAFLGMKKPAHVLLLTNRNAAQLVCDRLGEAGIPAKVYTAGVIANPEKLEDLMQLRLFSEILFPVEDCEMVSENPTEAAKVLGKSKLLLLLGSELAGEPPYTFRVEVRSKDEPDVQSTFAKKFGTALQVETEGDLINRPSSYEVELRLVKRADGGYRPLVKFMGLPDHRFAYRKAVTAGSLHPVNAALFLEYAKPYLKDGARVLDPMCGSGVLLAERMLIGSPDTVYGLDIYADALRAAKQNIEGAGKFAHLIQRDFRDFSHEHLFDEVITDFPSVRGKQSVQEIGGLYAAFFKKMPKLVREGGLLVLYTHDPALVRKYMGERFAVRSVHEISKREGSYLFLLTVR